MMSWGLEAIHGQSFTYIFLVSGISIVMVTSSNGSDTTDVVDPVALSEDVLLVEAGVMANQRCDCYCVSCD